MKHLEVIKKEINAVEEILKELRESADRADANHPQSQVDIGLKIDDAVKKLENLKNLYKTLGGQ